MHRYGNSAATSVRTIPLELFLSQPICPGVNVVPWPSFCVAIVAFVASGAAGQTPPVLIQTPVPPSIARSVQGNCVYGIPLEVTLYAYEAKRDPIRKLLIEEHYPAKWRFITADAKPTYQSSGVLSWFVAGQSLEPLVTSINYQLRPEAEAAEEPPVPFSGKVTLGTSLSQAASKDLVRGANEVKCQWQVRVSRRISGNCKGAIDVILEVWRGADAPTGIIVSEKPPAGWTIEEVKPPPARAFEDGIGWALGNEEAATLSYRLLPKSPASSSRFSGHVGWESSQGKGLHPTIGMQEVKCE